MKNRDFSMPIAFTTCKLREVSRGVSKKSHSGGGFFWRGFLVVLRKTVSSRFSEKPRFLLASVFSSDTRQQEFSVMSYEKYFKPTLHA